MATANPADHATIAEAILAISFFFTLIAGVTLASDARAGDGEQRGPKPAPLEQGCGGARSDPAGQTGGGGSPAPSPAGCTGAIPVPGGPNASAEDSEPRRLTRIPFHNLGGHVVVPVRINGSRTLQMVLDTGMSAPIVLLSRPGLAEELGLEGGQPALIGGAGGQAARQGSFYTGAVVSIGDLELKNQTLVAMGACGSSAPCMQDGVIGKSIFDHYPVEIDFDSSTLSIHQGEFDGNGFAEVPLNLTLGIPTVGASIEPERGREIPVSLVLDLGARHAVSFYPNEEKGVTAPDRALAATVGRGIQGELSGRVGRLGSLSLGPFRFRDVVGSFADVEGGTTCAAQGVTADGNLGTGILSRFTVVLDYPHKRVLLRPNSRFQDPFEYNMAGLSLERQEDGSYLVRSVVDDSPGAQAGLERGDRIVEIDGRKLASHPDSESAEEFLKEGGTLRVKVERGESRFDRTLKLRRLI